MHSFLPYLVTHPIFNHFNVLLLVINSVQILALDLLKTRVCIMQAQDTRKIFIGNVLAFLIEKTTDAKVSV